jgi:zinc transport system permease protein
MSDTLSHVSLLGVVIGLVLNLNPNLTTLIIVAIAAVILEYLRQLYRSYSELALAILMSGALALALFLAKFQGTTEININQYLIGSIITVSSLDLIILIILLFVLFVLFFLFKRPMYIMVFDEDIAFVDGLPVRQMSIIFNVLTGLVIAMMIPMTGALLVSAVMILPAASGLKIAQGFNSVIISSIIIGVVGMIGGLAISTQLETPPGATITLVFIIIFFFANLIKHFGRKI